MKATICVQYGPPSTAFEYKENYAKPEITKPNQILIKNKLCSVNPADCKQSSGNLKLVLKHQFPFILCQDFAGVVVEVGKDVKKFQVGDNVFGCTNGAENGKQPRNSCAAEYLITFENECEIKPDTISFNPGTFFFLLAYSSDICICDPHLSYYSIPSINFSTLFGLTQSCISPFVNSG